MTDTSELLNIILSNTCPSNVEEDGTNLFIYDLHCATIEIRAKVRGKAVENDDLSNDYMYTLFSVVDYKVSRD